MSMVTRAELIAQFVPNSPLGQLLGIKLVDVSDDRSEIVLKYRDDLATLGQTVHGGAIATLADVAATAAAWADNTVPDKVGGSTVSLTVDFVAPAVGKDLTAVGRVIRRGKRICTCEVDVVDSESQVVAKALATYNFA